MLLCVSLVISISVFEVVILASYDNQMQHRFGEPLLITLIEMMPSRLYCPARLDQWTTKAQLNGAALFAALAPIQNHNAQRCTRGSEQLCDPSMAFQPTAMKLSPQYILHAAGIHINMTWGSASIVSYNAPGVDNSVAVRRKHRRPEQAGPKKGKDTLKQF